jgi:hypothetical protein
MALEFCYRVHNSPPVFLILSHTNTLLALLSETLRISCVIFLKAMPRSSYKSLCCKLYIQNTMQFCAVRYSY